MPELNHRRVLVVEDDPAHLRLMAEAVRSLGVAVEEAATAGSAIATLARTPIDVVLLDVALPDVDGFELHRSMRRLQPAPQVVFVTANDLVESGVTAVLDGAANYVVKRENYLEVVVRVVGELVEESRPQRDFGRFAARDRTATLIGESSAIAEVRRLIDDFGATDATVLISGETGTGKELVARGLHERSQRREKPFVAVNCAAIPESLVESELFGARRGSYTGLQHDRRGVIGEANGGTLFLDEVGDLSLSAQAKLLRLLESSRYRPVGGLADLEATCRFVAATNRDLRADVRSGRFRGDLFFRLDVLRIDLPRLSERRCDIPLLVREFLHDCGANEAERWIQESAWRQLISEQWRGNVRELRHAVQRTVVRWRGGPIERFEVASETGVQAPNGDEWKLSREQLERLMLGYRGQLAAVAKELGVSVRTIQRRVRAYGLEPRRFRSSVRNS